MGWHRGPAPEAALQAIDPIIDESHLHGRLLAAVASQRGLLHVEYGPGPLPHDRGHVAALPLLLPIIAARQSSPAYLTVQADRTGADITARGCGDANREETVDGSSYPLSRNQPGGWSQPRYQHRAENTWAHNARNVADQVMAMAEQVDPIAIFVAGDVRPVQLIRDSLPDGLDDHVVEVEGGRGEDGSEARFARVVEERVMALTDLARHGVEEKFRQELGQRDRAVEGPQATLQALAQAQVRRAARGGGR